VEYGAHLPLIDLGEQPSLSGLRNYAQAARDLGYLYLCANDHLLFARPWLDGLTALAAVIQDTGEMTLATTVSLPVLRGPAQLAKTLLAIDLLADERLVVGVGPGSSARDYAAAGVPFAERWQRFEDAVRALRSLLAGDPDGFQGVFYSTRGVVLEPRPRRRSSPPIWVASWGSPTGLRRVARLGDGWLASAYNISPARFRACLSELNQVRGTAGPMPNALATTWMYVTDDELGADRVLSKVLAPMLNRTVEQLAALALPIGPAELCAQRISEFAAAGVQRLLVWPLGDEIRQLSIFRHRVAPLVTTQP
jgi:alkanesulfonate monooxygenase SsuD/methylene tetrahydromethanopterin reductase-like flavin-dependent oxidoreductase (luciferase family)